MADYYEFITNPSVKKIGARAWLNLAITIAELLVVIKFRENLFDTPTPIEVKTSWLIFGLCICIWFIWFFYIRRPTTPKKKQ